ncbi:hypothetical protein P154DRAFT_200774 [Amniculicola lignicola CBS 123094]|uniref:Uncharacterized protein n=1 Tax=Amniculicola lignicola CBS 123094 TaxID=1392246 RepID=A0A6A5WEN0_9PLEO|nr:hypothetical protein P154DRAFT_200774 [Amniculicola lignicola CBS 123094]
MTTTRTASGLKFVHAACGAVGSRAKLICAAPSIAGSLFYDSRTEGSGNHKVWLGNLDSQLGPSNQTPTFFQ